MEIKPISWQEALPLRHQVLWPNEPPAFSKVEGDEDALHYGAFLDGEIVCVASIHFSSEFTDAHNKTKNARLRKFATSQAHQGQGIGSLMLKRILTDLKQEGASIFWCDARETAMGLYERFGMHAEGERFYKGDIPYFRMSKNVENA
ncbi:GNAT family N-acetyltransferase [Enterovibrio norvegicus]|uniref:GNAT family N-acetyltransferase n=1 Tax=Enterovibrio norvegicus TaxID=188144 RepID=UPI0024B26626|nr:GNAT family N-acetyltransferase [Enterovibrio norvegicus]